MLRCLDFTEEILAFLLPSPRRVLAFWETMEARLGMDCENSSLLLAEGKCSDVSPFVLVLFPFFF